MSLLLTLGFFVFVDLGIRSSPIPVIFRYDDYWASWDEDRTYVDRKVLQIHADHGVPVTVGVTPMKSLPREEPTADLKEDPTRLRLLREYANKGLLEVALHGYSHTDRATGIIRSEFWGLSLEEQTELVLTAKRKLEHWVGQEVEVFIPPWNTYDSNTLEVLERKSFELLSAEFLGGPTPQDSLLFAPAWMGLSRTGYILRLARGESVGKDGGELPPIIVLVHPHDFFESGDNRAQVSLQTYEGLIKSVADSDYLRGATFSCLVENPEKLEPLAPPSTILSNPLAVTVLYLMKSLGLYLIF